MNRYVKRAILFLWFFICFFMFSCKANAITSKTNDRENNTGKRCYGLRNDMRTSERGFDLNIMITGCFEKIFNEL